MLIFGSKQTFLINKNQITATCLVRFGRREIFNSKIKTIILYFIDDYQNTPQTDRISIKN